MLSVLRGSQCLSAAVLQGQTVTIRRAAWAGRLEAPSLSARVARRSLPAGAGMAQRGLPLSHKGNVQTVTSDFLSADSLGPGTHLHLILLNYVLPPQTAHLWQQATTRICADGGANRLYDQIPVMLPGTDPFAAREAHLPDLIKGDLDSVRADVTDFYTSRGVPFIDLSSDQETTDLEKCLLFLEGRLRAMSEDAARQTADAQVAAAAAAAAAQSTATAGSAAGGRHGHGAKAIGAANAAARAYATGIGPSSSSNGSSGTTLHLDSSSSSSAATASTNAGMGPPIPHGTAADDSSSVQQQQQQQEQQQQQQQEQQQQQQQQQLQGHQICGDIVMLPGLQEQHARLQQPQQQLPQQQRLHTGPGRYGSSNSSTGAGLSQLESSQGTVGQQGSNKQQHRHVHEVTASILSSHGAAGDEPARKRLQQDHLILVLGALGGRLDHTLANLNTLYCYPHLNITLWGEGNLVRLLRAGRSVIKPSRLEGPTCGLVPLARPATASSKGLKWDLDDTHARVPV
ncbi:hypothetical protein COO60DRAFT_1704370 [Scenedesmus sp. NREL 46B-D3]|nr:hypothetical protein COO60DRAFT_1704370 [Scenedesmus sp. NREL 46B-D3]